jgi:hypothetical protein
MAKQDGEHRTLLGRIAGFLWGIARFLWANDGPDVASRRLHEKVIASRRLREQVCSGSKPIDPGTPEGGRNKEAAIVASRAFLTTFDPASQPVKGAAHAVDELRNWSLSGVYSAADIERYQLYETEWERASASLLAEYAHWCETNHAPMLPDSEFTAILGDHLQHCRQRLKVRGLGQDGYTTWRARKEKEMHVGETWREANERRREERVCPPALSHAAYLAEQERVRQNLDRAGNTGAKKRPTPLQPSHGEQRQRAKDWDRQNERNLGNL